MALYCYSLQLIFVYKLYHSASPTTDSKAYNSHLHISCIYRWEHKYLLRMDLQLIFTYKSHRILQRNADSDFSYNLYLHINCNSKYAQFIQLFLCNLYTLYLIPCLIPCELCTRILCVQFQLVIKTRLPYREYSLLVKTRITRTFSI